MKTGPSKKCTARAAAHVINDEQLRLCLLAQYGVHRLSHGPWKEHGHTAQRIVLHFLTDYLCTEEHIAGADGFIGGYCTAKSIHLNPP